MSCNKETGSLNVKTETMDNCDVENEEINEKNSKSLETNLTIKR